MSSWTIVVGFFELFVNPWMLAGLSLLSAPIIIHLINRRRFEIVDWAAMDFLLEAAAKNRRRLRLEDLLLLLLRLLLITLIVLAVARPLTRSFAVGNESERIIIVDESGSMRADSGTGPVFVAARAAAAQLVEESVAKSLPFSVWTGSRREEISSTGGSASASDAGSFETAAGTGSAETAEISAEELARRANAVKRVRELVACDAPLQLGALIDRLADKTAVTEATGIGSLTILSDFRAVDWLAVTHRASPSYDGGAAWEVGGELRGDIAAALREMQKESRLKGWRWRLVDVGGESVENVAVSGLELDRNHPAVGLPVRITVAVTNHGRQERTQIGGWLEVGDPGGGTLVESAARASEVTPGLAPAASAFRVTRRLPLPGIPVIAPGQTVTTEVTVTFEKAGEYPLIVNLTGSADVLPQDDTAYMVVPVREGLRVLLVDGDPARERLGGEAGFLAAALAPRGTVSTGLTVQRETGPIRAATLATMDVVLVLNRAALDPEEAVALRAFVNRGGGLGFFLGGHVDPSRYSRLVGNAGGTGREGDAPIFPAILTSLNEAGALQHLVLAVDDHPTFEMFRGVEGASIGAVGFTRFFKLRPLPSARVVAHYDDADKTPAIIELAVGHKEDSEKDDRGAGAADAEAPRMLRGHARAGGRIVLFNTTADRDWNDWPTDGSFPIVLQEWVRYLAPSRVAQRFLEAGDALLVERFPGVNYRVSDPRGQVRPGNADGPSSDRIIYGDTHWAGFYRVEPRSAVQGVELPEAFRGSRWYACNGRLSESALQRVDPPILEAAFGAAGVDVVVGDGEAVRQTGDEGDGELWRWLALLVAVFLLGELGAAWWIGRGQ